MTGWGRCFYTFYTAKLPMTMIPTPSTTPVCSSTRRAERAEELRQLGATDKDLAALLEYTETPFDFSGPLVLGDEPFVTVWDEYAEASEAEGVFPVLQRALVQLRFPVREGISETGVYRSATRRGDVSALGTSGLLGDGPRLTAPERLRLEIHPTPAGRIPVLTAPVREDFEAIVQALTRRNEPTLLPASMGALMVSGHNNWDRVRRYREAWAARSNGGETWADAFRRMIPQKERYQDRFILLSEGPYSAVPASDLGLDEAEWTRISHAIRKEHECAHYYCKRALGAMRYHIFDEVIADAYGLIMGAGFYEPEWMLRFLGLDHDGPLPREGCRMWNYCDGLSDGSVRVISAFVKRRVQTVEAVAADCSDEHARLIRNLARSL